MSGTPEGLREAEDSDAAALAELVGGVYAEYAGCVLDLPGIDRDLTSIRTHLGAYGGRLWVLPGDDGLTACVGYAPLDAGDRVELKRLYVRREARRGGIGSALTELVIDLARTLQATEVALWSDSRFTDAHRHYGRHGWERQPETRRLEDPSDTTEFHFTRPVEPAPPATSVEWRGDDGARQRAALYAHPFATHLIGADAGEAWRYTLTTDERGFTRHVAVHKGGTTVLTSDGLGRWWRGGRRDHSLDGCTDVDLEMTPATNTLPIRRARAAGLGELAVQAAWVRWPSLEIAPVTQRYVRLSERTWRYDTASGPHDLDVDAHGVVRRYGEDLFVAS